jgi:3-hydroxyacyl-CoA dehydrogenase
MVIRKVGVVGCGLMGHGIVQIAAQGGCEVTALETEQRFLDSGLARIDKSLAKLAEKAVEKGKATPEVAKAEAQKTRARIKGSLDKQDLADCDLVVEAIVEDLAVKKKLFAELGKICKPATILASNTSSFPIAEMGAASGRPQNMVGLHFFNPVQLMRLVEVVRTDKTSDEAFAAARAFGEACGKTPVSCKDTPGFVVNRLLVPYMVQAMQMLERGDATKEDIDTAMKLYEAAPTDKPADDDFAAARAFGESVGKTPVSCKDTPGFVVNRLLVPYMVQSLLMLERGDASKEDIDAAMQFGCGYPMGPITLTDYVGLDTTLYILRGWVERYPTEPAFQIPHILEQKVAQGKLGRKTGEGFYKWEGDKKT